MAAGSADDAIVAYNSAQPWSPAHGIVNGSSVRMTFGAQELSGSLLPSGYIVWDNGSKWLKTTQPTRPPSGAAAANGGLPAANESYSYSCAPRRRASQAPTHPRTPTATPFCAADDGASYTDEGDSYSYDSCAPLRLKPCRLRSASHPHRTLTPALVAHCADEEDNAPAKAKSSHSNPPKAKAKTTNAKLPQVPLSRPKTASNGRHRR